MQEKHNPSKQHAYHEDAECKGYNSLRVLANSAETSAFLKTHLVKTCFLYHSTDFILTATTSVSTGTRPYQHPDKKLSVVVSIIIAVCIGFSLLVILLVTVGACITLRVKRRVRPRPANAEPVYEEIGSETGVSSNSGTPYTAYDHSVENHGYPDVMTDNRAYNSTPIALGIIGNGGHLPLTDDQLQKDMTQNEAYNLRS